jgi:hypothetical protein
MANEISTVGRKYVRAALLTPSEKKEVDDMLKPSRTPVKDKGEFMEVIAEYPELSDGDEKSLDRVIRLRQKRKQLTKELGLTKSDEEMIFGFRRMYSPLYEFTERVKDRYLDKILDNVSDASLFACDDEIERVRLLMFVKKIGGIKKFYPLLGELSEDSQMHCRCLRTTKTPTGKILYGYDHLFNLNLADAVTQRILASGEAKILDAGCGDAKAFGELLAELTQTFGGYEITQDGAGDKLIKFARGEKLKLVGVSRRKFHSPPFVNYHVCEISDFKTSERFDEIWDVCGPFIYSADKKALITEVYYPLLQKASSRGSPGTMRILAENLRLRNPDGSPARREKIQVTRGVEYNPNRKARSIPRSLFITREEDALSLPWVDAGVGYGSLGGGRLTTDYVVSDNSL